MDPVKFIELQKQMRENNEEFADFVNDLGSWRKSVESKNLKLKTGTEPVSELPAVRNSLLRKKKKRKYNPSPASSAPVKPILNAKPRDYAEWDKILKELENKEEEEEEEPELQNESQEESSETDEEQENLRRMGLAKEAREMGNVRFKEGNFNEAVEHYTTAIRLTPEDPVPYNNRAFAYLKLERYASTEADCSLALALDPVNPKALFRRALARKMLENNSAAIDDLNALLKVDTNNKSAQKELSLLTIKHPALQASDVSTNGNHSTGRKLRRIPIVEVGGSLGSLNSNKAPLSDAPDTRDFRPPSLHHSSLTNGISNNSYPVRPSSPQTRLSTSLCITDHHKHETSSLPTLDIPTSWYQLERDLRELHGQKGKSDINESVVQYLCSIPPDRYSTVIGQNLEPSFISLLLRALERTTSLTMGQIASRLLHLGKLSRFDVAWLLVDENVERALFDRLLARLSSAENIDSETLKDIRKIYV